MKIDLKLPVAFTVNDYHEFDYFLHFVKKMSLKMKIAEVAFGSLHGSGRGLYWGVVYCGRKPSRKTITQLLSDAGYSEIEDEY